jgi:predicted metal-dependent enzyme (double-stranded beta helix superfamily)
MFDLERFVDDCRRARAADASHKPIAELVARAVAEPEAVVATLGEPKRGGVETLYHAPDLTILNLVWPGYMVLMPHEHRMWAVIGIYGGREDNVFWRRCGDRVEAAGARALGTGDVAPLGADIVHSVTNPIPRLTGAIHIYGGDFFGTARSEWNPETLVEQPHDPKRLAGLFEAANRRAEA